MTAKKMTAEEVRKTLMGIFPFLSDKQFDELTALFLPSQQEVKEEADQNIENAVTDLLREIGIPANLIGHRYIREAIILCLEDKKMIDRVTKGLYPTVEKKFATTSSRAERAIRHAIEVAWNRGSIEVFESYFGYTIDNKRGKPTNSEFIAMLTDMIRLKYKL